MCGFVPPLLDKLVSDLDPVELQLVEDDDKLPLPLSCKNCGRVVPVRPTVSLFGPEHWQEHPRVQVSMWPADLGRLGAND
jgi:hypothetical protein